MTTRFMVVVGSMMDSSFDTYEEAENRVAEIKSKYAWIADIDVHITEY